MFIVDITLGNATKLLFYHQICVEYWLFSLSSKSNPYQIPSISSAVHQNINTGNGTNYFFFKTFSPGFPASLACSLILTLLLGGLQVCHLWMTSSNKMNVMSKHLQALVLPRTTILLLLFLTAFIWIAVILMLLLAVRLRWVWCNHFILF